MKWYTTSHGRPRLWLEQDEIECIMEDELRDCGLFPTAETPAVDIETFLERRASRLDQYADLGDSVLGVTEFISGEAPMVHISSKLTSDAEMDGAPLSTVGRWRATLAHEAAHVVLHGALFEPEFGQRGLFQTSTSGQSSEDAGEFRNPVFSDVHARRLTKHPRRLERGLRCLKRDISFGAADAAGQWREVQANKGMAALLMPRNTFTVVAEVERTRMGFSSGPFRPKEAEILALEVAARFQVSRQAACIRMQTLGFIATMGQEDIAFGRRGDFFWH